MPQTVPGAAADGTSERVTVTATGAVDDLLGALSDADCRAILDAAGDEALCAREVADRCDLPLSTTYRKLDRLTATGLLSERTRVEGSGRHASEYVRRVESAHVSLDAGHLVVRRTSGAGAD
jgi:DNA-binding transcriptional ArsR family regulator